MIFTAVPNEALGIVWGDVVRVLNKSVETSAGKFHIDDIYKEIDIRIVTGKQRSKTS